MKCEELHRLLSLHLDSELTPETASDLQRHLDGCASCAGRVRVEERLERRIREALTRPSSGDDEAWRRAMESLPRRRRWWIPAAAALAFSATAVFLLARHRELDLAAELARHHAKYVEGQSPLGVESSDPAEAARFFEGRLPFACGGAPPEGMRLVGARMCYLEGAPAAFYIFHRGSSVVVVAVCSAADLARFPAARTRLEKEGEVHCRVEGMAFVLVGDGSRAASAVGDAPPDELTRLARAFLAR